jgi:hypothetical protein
MVSIRFLNENLVHFYMPGGKILAATIKGTMRK